MGNHLRHPVSGKHVAHGRQPVTKVSVARSGRTRPASEANAAVNAKLARNGSSARKLGTSTAAHLARSQQSRIVS